VGAAEAPEWDGVQGLEKMAEDEDGRWRTAR
jgi:hypothetical protein